ncbi:helix-hairpin-helix domain-containing protein [Hymenobacter sp. HSC-4F20]|uniref:ComEA family DNA-binding protein n=1 Tax=Hymenobacter sp. HSC-4F20 TaxID=2864135 RepID=UPI001C736149|nr:helix-hairpin-helix domain-containing protein [Hymenobacter sp. HSC-4F20]MBX0291028.1 helix-hairpin-helix domain-containing protein [Hymenobacter sp. HSC-4F20]
MPVSQRPPAGPASKPPRRRGVFLLGQRTLRRYFGFSRRETSGFVVLVGLLLLWLVLPSLLRPALPSYDPAPDQRRLNAWATELAARRTARPAFTSRYPHRGAPVAQVPLAPFNPNQLSEMEWEARGLPRYVARRIVRYREVIGGFRAKEQIRRTYGLDDSVYTRLAPYIQLPDQLPPHEPRQYAANRRKEYFEHQPFSAGASRFARKPARLAPFDLNAADTTQLMQIRGIGRGYARRIVEYRQRLGGFRTQAQTAEIYSLRDAPDLVDSLRKYTFVAPSFAPTPLDVNNAPFEVLQAHPYVGKRLARVLVAFRQQHGPFRQPTDLRQIRILDQATYEKLAPYLVLR